MASLRISTDGIEIKPDSLSQQYWQLVLLIGNCPVEATLTVPFTPGSVLKDAIQKIDEDFCKLVKSRKIRVIEAGGDKLINLLGRNDPWSNQRVCDDSECPPCTTRTWINEERKEAKKANQKLPTILETKTNHNCRRESLNYTIQCIPCVKLGRRTLYRGESSRSARQRHKEHHTDIQKGLVNSPLVTHSIMEHGGTKPEVIYLIDKIEPRPLYRIVRESVKIANMPTGPERMNRCNEWGAPRVPVLTVQGGDNNNGFKTGEFNPRMDWTTSMNKRIEEGNLKRIRYWIPDTITEEDNQDPAENDSNPPPSKRRKGIIDIQEELDPESNTTTTQLQQQQTTIQPPQHPIQSTTSTTNTPRVLQHSQQTHLHSLLQPNNPPPPPEENTPITPTIPPEQHNHHHTSQNNSTTNTMNTPPPPQRNNTPIVQTLQQIHNDKLPGQQNSHDVEDSRLLQVPIPSGQKPQGPRSKPRTAGSTGGEGKAGPKVKLHNFGSKDIRLKYQTADVASKDATPARSRSSQSLSTGSRTKSGACKTPKQRDLRSWISVKKKENVMEDIEGALRDGGQSNGVDRDRDQEQVSE